MRTDHRSVQIIVPLTKNIAKSIMTRNEYRREKYGDWFFGYFVTEKPGSFWRDFMVKML